MLRFCKKLEEERNLDCAKGKLCRYVQTKMFRAKVCKITICQQMKLQRTRESAILSFGALQF